MKGRRRPQRSTITTIPAEPCTTLRSTARFRVAVPSVPSGLAHAAARFGLLSSRTLDPMITPAIEHAEHGITVTPKMARHFAAYHDFLSRYPATARIFTRPGGPVRAGETLRQPDLAKTLTHISEVGLQGFSQGMLAHRLDRFMAAHGGLINRQGSGRLPAARARHYPRQVPRATPC